MLKAIELLHTLNPLSLIWIKEIQLHQAGLER